MNNNKNNNKEDNHDDERIERNGGKRALPTFNGKRESFPVWKARVRAWLQAESPPLLYVLDETLVVSDVASGSGGSSSLLSSGGSGKGMKKKVDVLDETLVVSGVASGSGDSSSSSGKIMKKKLERQELDRLKVYNALISALDDIHVGIIVSEVAEGDALGAWKIMLRKYERNTVASRNQLRRELHTLKLGISEGMDEYKSRGLFIVSRLKAAQEVVSEGEVLFCLLEGLPTEYEMVRQALEVQDIVNVEDAFVHLREMEDKIRRRGVITNETGNASWW
jgi:hypothetical protein